MGGSASSSSTANDAPIANQNTLPDQPPIPVSTSAR
jgi:hypothetical protein